MNRSLRLMPLSLLLLAWTALAGPLAFVTNERAGVSVIDLDQFTVQRTFATGGEGPRGLSVTPNGQWVVTANKGSSDISVLDVATGAMVKRIPVGKNVEFVRVQGDFAYVTYEPSGPGAPDGGKPDAGKTEAGKPDTPKADAGKSEKAAKDDKEDDLVPAEIAVVDLQQGRVVRSMKSGRETEGIEFSADGRQMLVANEGENTVTVYDRAAGTILRKIDVSAQGNRPRGIKRSPDGKLYAVTLEFSDKVLLVDAATFAIQKSAATKKSPYGVSFDDSGTRLFVAASRSSVIQVFDVATLTAQGEIPVGARCWHFTFAPDGKHLLAACGRSDTLVVADTTTLQVTKTLTGFKGPWGIVTYPRSRGSIDTP